MSTKMRVQYLPVTESITLLALPDHGDCVTLYAVVRDDGAGDDARVQCLATAAPMGVDSAIDIR